VEQDLSLSLRNTKVELKKAQDQLAVYKNQESKVEWEVLDEKSPEMKL
jgi:hypothetical protein